MKAIKIFNNNVVLVNDKNKQQRILFGKGIGFGKHVGDEIKPGKNVQTFVKNIKDPTWINSLSNLLDNVPLEYLAVSKDIITNAEKQLQTTFNQFLIISLADHIYFAVKRNKKQSIAYLTSVKEVYPLEYRVAKDSVKKINSTFNVTLSDGEAGLIAIHFVENELKPAREIDESNENTAALHLSKVLQIIISDLGYPSNPTALDRTTVHLRYLISQIQTNNTYIDDPSDDNKAVLNSFLLQFPELKGTLKKLQDYFFETMKYKLNSSERLYLVVHLRQIENSSMDE